ncbi:hypothetical protein F4859DRAFT_496359 [Xylaria cf. heliscus]|nr:hypothetical protein F4859DRAFT_496359 [Xylaria cf. heliscus]
MHHNNQVRIQLLSTSISPRPRDIKIMTFQPGHHGRRESSRRRPLRTITNHDANPKREKPLIKTLLRNKLKTLPPRAPTDPNTRRHAPSQRPKAGEVIIHQFSNPGQFDGVLRIFSCLPSIPGLAGRAPRLHSQDRNRLEIQLQYSNYGIWRLIDRLHERCDRTVPRLSLHDIRQLRDTLSHDIRILCASHIALNSDVSFLRIIHQRKPSGLFLPLLDAFDLNRCTEKDVSTIDWTELERDMVRKVETQFQVFELLAQLDSPTRFEQQSKLKLEPEDALCILRANPPYDRKWCLVVAQVGRYTPELARYTIEDIARHLYVLQKRTSLPPYYPSRVLSNYSNTIRYVLRLSTTAEGVVQQNINLLADRAYLSVLHAAVLVHSHAKIIEVDFSEGLLQLDCPGLAEAYTSYEDFHLVTEGYREAQEAIRTLHDAGGKLERVARWFIRNMH